MKKKLFTILLSFSMVVGLLPATISLAAETEHTHCVCGTAHKAIGDHMVEDQTEFTAWTSTDSLPDTAGNYYLDNDVTLSEAVEYTDNSSLNNRTGYCGWNVPDGVVLCLNGHSISMQNPQNITKDVDTINVLGHFTLTDCKNSSEQGKITHASDSSNGKYSGKGVKVSGGTFDMYGGTISGNTSAYDTGGSGVSVKGVSDTSKASLFNMYGGQISGNTAKSGGGVNVSRVVWYGSSEFRMFGGSITGNVADSDVASYGTGGGVYVSWTARFVMTGGQISGNTASQFGGGIYASALAADSAYGSGGAAELKISGSSTITGNKVGDKGNNICLDSSKTDYQAFSAKLDIANSLNGTIGVNSTTPPTAETPIIIATGAASGTDYSKNIISDDTQYLVQHEGNVLMLTTEGYTHTHSWGEWKYDDNQHWQVCNDCNYESTHADHTWDNGVITLQPTTTDEGEKTFTCNECQATKVEAIDKLPLITYEILEGANSSWTQNSDGDLTFRANGDFSKFTGVKVDGNIISTDEYTVASGSTVITLKKDYLATLSAGKHELTVVYNDGECSTEFEIKAESSHTHSYGTEWRYDAENHWHECVCGEKTDNVTHTFKWIIDKEATATEKGFKHEECTICGYKKAAVEISSTGSVTKSTDKPVKSGDKKSPKTGDNSDMIAWFILLAASACIIGSLRVIRRQRRR